MIRQPDEHQDDPVVAAIESVLQAERDGEQQLRTVRERGEKLVATARAEAAAIALRTDSRIAKLHARYLQKVQEQSSAIARRGASPGEDDSIGHDPTALAQAARRIAGQLTGET